MHSRFRLSTLAVSVVFLTACSVKPLVISETAHQELVANDKAQLYAEQEPLKGELTLHQAMARAIKYNFDNRLKMMEEALAHDMADISRLDMLPRLTMNAGYRGRNNDSGASSRSLITGQESLQVSTSQERERMVADLGISWSVLDFGLSYYRAKQQADRMVIVHERHRKVIQNITQDVRSTYFRALTAQKVLAGISPLIKKVEAALTSSRSIEQQGLDKPVNALRYQHRLLTSLRKLQIVRKKLVTAKAELAALMSLPMSAQLQLANEPLSEMKISQSVQELEQQALMQRPELREERYHDRISATEIKRTMASLMPALTLNTTYNYDSNAYNENSNWLDFSAMISGNLMDLVTYKQRMHLAEDQAKVVDTRRLALNIAVISQVHIAMQDFVGTQNTFNTDRSLSDIEQRLLKQYQASSKSQSGNDMELIEQEVNTLVGRLHEGQSYADLQTAYGRVYLSIGADSLPEHYDGIDVDALAKELARGELGWQAMKQDQH